MENTKIGFIGGGNMAASLIGGLIADEKKPEYLWVSDPDPQRRVELAEKFKVNVTDDNQTLVKTVDVVVLAVKPQVLKTVCENISEAVLSHAPLVVSVAAGIRTDDIDRWLGGKAAIVRTMPNTPALVRSGATALSANSRVSESQREQAEALMRAVGVALWLEREEQMDAVTALSGSGPAYFFLIMEILEQTGSKLGLPEDTARLLALETAFGAAKMALESTENSVGLRRRVTSPGGTTERALAILEQGGIRQLFEEALTGARDRARDLAEQLGSEGS